jgi:hypothetical protein
MMNTEPKWVNTPNNSRYTWCADLGTCGGFIEKNSNGETLFTTITINNIGEITPCLTTVEYSHINDCIGVSETTLELPNIPIGSKYGWDSKAYCWVYYMINSVMPSYFAKRK